MWFLRIPEGADVQTQQWLIQCLWGTGWKWQHVVRFPSFLMSSILQTIIPDPRNYPLPLRMTLFFLALRLLPLQYYLVSPPMWSSMSLFYRNLLPTTYVGILHEPKSGGE
jgi:hypothetical protein